MPSDSFEYGVDKLTVSKALKIAEGKLKGYLSPACLEKVSWSKGVVDKMAQGEAPVYGINTGFGPLCSTKISQKETELLQYNILKSHSVGVGSPIPKKMAKLMLILKMHALSQGHSGVAISTLERINWHIDHDVIPVVPSQGSVGASGDLAPLAHLFLPLIGLGRVIYKDDKVDTQTMLDSEQMEGIKLHPKEGLCLINGTQFIAAYATTIVDKLHSCLSHADIIGALMLEGLLGSPSPFDAKLHALRPYPGNIHVAQRISGLLKGSDIVASHADCNRVQDPYSLRCIPQVHGASRTTWLHLKELTEIEINSVTDNPVIVGDNECISGGNFHGQPLALPLDYACLAASELGSISDRRIYLSLMGVAKGVPKLLMENTGANSAFMMLQYTTAALASENKTACFPASADSIPTSLGQEDHVSMGSISGRKALHVIDNLEKILAIELMCAAQSFDYHKPLKSSKTLDRVHELVRATITHAEEDRVFSDDINKAIHIIQERSILKCVNENSESINSDYNHLFEQY